MSARSKRFRRPLAAGLAVLVCLAASGCASSGPSRPQPDAARAVLAALDIAAYAPADGEVPSYAAVRNDMQQKGTPVGSGSIHLSAIRYSAVQDEDAVSVETLDGEDGVLVWKRANAWVEYEVLAEQEGLYALEARYKAADPDGGVGRMLFAFMLNGELPFREASSLLLDRLYKDKEGEREQYDTRGNQLRPAVEPVRDWLEGTFRDSEGAYAEPVLWHLKRGSNTIRLSSLLDPAAIVSLSFKPLEPIPSYEEALANYPVDEGGGGEPILIEAEQYESKTSASIAVNFDRDPATTPTSFGKVRLNALGGNSWSRGRQTVSWTFEVPRDGRYALTLRVKQSFRENLTSFRTVAIDGRVPFREFEAYPIPYDGGWQTITLADVDGVPYEVYLTKGQHSISLESMYEPFVPIRLALDRLAAGLGEEYELLRQATGNRMDPFRVWQVEAELPGLTSRLASLQADLSELEAAMKAVNGKRDNVSQSIRAVKEDLGRLLREPDEIPYHMTELSEMQAKLEQQREDLAESPLMIEKIAVTPATEPLPRLKAGWWSKVKGQMAAVSYSFNRSNRLDTADEQKLQVWMLWSRDYVNELQRLADEQFTPKTGVEVQINLIASQDLLIPSSAAGILPDVALGIPSNVPYELALRGAALDLSQLPGADQLFSAYSPGMLVPYFHEGGYYAVPETANMKMLFYRKDILERLGLDVPQTWDDVYRMLPVLLQSDYNFYVNPADASYVFFQRGVDYYTSSGQATALDQPEAYEAFKAWIDLFNQYGLERQVQSFYNQFRKGTIPIGVSDLNDYLRLLVAAPELTNRWGIAPVPGTIGEDGEVERWVSAAGASGASSTSVMMFEQIPEEKRDAAWSFIQWYLSEEVQSEYGMNLEQFYGEAFRWSSANIRAFARMPWKQDDLLAMLAQWPWIKEVPNVPGGYMTARELDFAWNRATINLQPPRIALDQAVKQINRELARKQREFEGVNQGGEPDDSGQLPFVHEPWEEADRLVDID